MAEPDLVTWLRAQLDDDERVALECAGAPWSADIPGAVHVSSVARAENRAWRTLGHVAHVERDADRKHIARWDPARVLTEVEAKRRILDECLAVWADEGGTQIGDLPETVVRLLAQLYAGRDGWREEWRP